MRPRMRTRRHHSEPAVVLAEASLFGSIVVFHVLDHHVLPDRVELPAHVAVGLAAPLAGYALGASIDDLGLAPSALRRGVTMGLAHGSVSMVALAAAAFLPGLEPLLADPRAKHETTRHAVRRLLIEIPVGTAVYEELVFRSALLGLAERRWSRGWAVAATSAVFGLWHVFPALEDRRHNAVAQRYSMLATVAPTVLSTAVAGALFSRLRVRAGHVVAPIIAHAMFNMAGFLAAQIVHVRMERSQDTTAPGPGDRDSPATSMLDAR